MSAVETKDTKAFDPPKRVAVKGGLCGSGEIIHGFPSIVSWSKDKAITRQGVSASCDDKDDFTAKNNIWLEPPSNRGWFIQEKIDGSQFSFRVRADGTLLFTNKSKPIQPAPAGSRATFAVAMAAIQALHHAQPKLLDRRLTYHGEAIEKPKHNVVKYGMVPPHYVILYDMQSNISGAWLWPEELEAEAKRIGLMCVPTLHHNELTPWPGLTNEPLTPDVVLNRLLNDATAGKLRSCLSDSVSKPLSAPLSETKSPSAVDKSTARVAASGCGPKLPATIIAEMAMQEEEQDWDAFIEHIEDGIMGAPMHPPKPIPLALMAKVQERKPEGVTTPAVTDGVVPEGFVLKHHTFVDKHGRTVSLKRKCVRAEFKETHAKGSKIKTGTRSPSAFLKDLGLTYANQARRNKAIQHLREARAASASAVASPSASAHVMGLLPKPMSLVFEKLINPFSLIQKKQYVALGSGLVHFKGWDGPSATEQIWPDSKFFSKGAGGGVEKEEGFTNQEINDALDIDLLKEHSRVLRRDISREFLRAVQTGSFERIAAYQNDPLLPIFRLVHTEKETEQEHLLFGYLLLPLLNCSR